ncbi:hypothetical protein CH063_08299 [Colletotrichum higginsianum]|uniref:Uncharacterized protein n=1 Tax=Colletotrichum higginsianum (strain IMI 349063) TaxID=759273 RepID=H1V9B9_COLHI|nr:hypothetical protein CH063_08299 [Colletotrichum higginsianum]
MASSNSSQGSNALAAPSQDSNEDRAIKQILSVAVSKKKCREQLKNVVEKKYRRQNGQCPLFVEWCASSSNPPQAKPPEQPTARVTSPGLSCAGWWKTLASLSSGNMASCRFSSSSSRNGAARTTSSASPAVRRQDLDESAS